MIPSYAPFNDFITLVGFPFHGQVKLGTLTTDYSDTFSHTQPSDGLVVIQRNPITADVNRTTEQQTWDESKGFEWVDYLTFTGAEKLLAGNELGGNRWIYSDDNHRPWVIRAEVFVKPTDSTKIVLEVYLDSAFMLISPGSKLQALANIDTLLATHEYNIGSGGFEMQYLPDYDITNENGLEITQTGHKALMNIYQFNPTLTGGYFMFKNTYTELGGVWKIELSGSGAMSEDPEGGWTWGDGITAIISVQADHDEVFDALYDNVLEDNIDGGAGGWMLNLPDYIYPVKDGTSYNYNWDETDRSKNSSYFREQGEKTVFRYVFDDAGQPFQCHLIVGNRRLITRTGSSTGYYDGGWIVNCSARCDRVEDYVAGVQIYFPGGFFDIGFSSNDTSYNEGKDNPIVVSESFPYEFYADVVDYTETNNSVPTKIGGGIELLDAHTINARTTGLLTNVMHTTGAKYSNAAAQYVSYHPERLEWAADSTDPVSWA